MAASLGPVKVHSPEECEAMMRNERNSRQTFIARFLDYYISEVVD